MLSIEALQLIANVFDFPNTAAEDMTPTLLEIKKYLDDNNVRFNDFGDDERNS